MKTRLLLITLCFFSNYVFAEEASTLSTQKQKLSYFIGFQVGQSFKQQGLDVDVDIVSAGIKDVLTNAKPKMTMEEMKATVEILQKDAATKTAALAETNKAAGATNKKEGVAFLEANKKKEGVVTLPSGLQYKVITQGKGKKPKATDTVVVNYRGTLINGKEFDSSYKRGEPATFPVNGVIKGWQEILPLMQEGSKYQVVIPSDLAYGPQGTGGDIGPDATLLFDVELMSIK
ncbi:MAG: FKBP-type peptidyl-prolyl cis-trans isomerase [Gammaproteobacteria bacterium]